MRGAAARPRPFPKIKIDPITLQDVDEGLDASDLAILREAKEAVAADDGLDASDETILREASEAASADASTRASSVGASEGARAPLDFHAKLAPVVVKLQGNAASRIAPPPPKKMTGSSPLAKFFRPTKAESVVLPARRSPSAPTALPKEENASVPNAETAPVPTAAPVA